MYKRTSASPPSASCHQGASRVVPARWQRGVVRRVPPDVVSQTPVVEVRRSIDHGPKRDLGAPVLVKQHSVAGRQSRYRASDVQTGGYLVRPTTDQGVREDD